MMVYICEKRTGLYTLYRSTFLLFLFMYILNFPPLFCHDAKLNFGAHAFAFSVLSQLRTVRRDMHSIECEVYICDS